MVANPIRGLFGYSTSFTGFADGYTELQQRSNAGSLFPASGRVSSGIGANSAASRLFFAATAISSSDKSRQHAVDTVGTELTKLRDALLAPRDLIPFAAGRPHQHQEVTKGFQQTAEQPQYVSQTVYERLPVYEFRDILATTVTGSADLSGYSKFGDAGLGSGYNFYIQAGSGSLAQVSFKNNTTIEVTTYDSGSTPSQLIGGTTQSFSFTGTSGDWRNALATALDGVQNLNAAFTADGKLQLSTVNAELLTISQGDKSNKDPLPNLGLTAGTTDASVVGTEQVQVGSETVVVDNGQASSTDQLLVVGYQSVGIAPANVDTNVDQLVKAVNLLQSLSAQPPNSDNVRKFAADLGNLLKSSDFSKAVNTTDRAALDRVIGQIDDALGRLDGLRASFISGSNQTAAGATDPLSAALLGSGLQNGNYGNFGPSHSSFGSFGPSPFDSAAVGTLSFWT